MILKSTFEYLISVEFFKDSKLSDTKMSDCFIAHFKQLFLNLWCHEK
jgi:hypothetical protein